MCIFYIFFRILLTEIRTSNGNLIIFFSDFKVILISFYCILLNKILRMANVAQVAKNAITLKGSATIIVDYLSKFDMKVSNLVL